MKAGIRIKVLWFVGDMIELRVDASNGRFAGYVELYASHDCLPRLAKVIQGFPETTTDVREFELGTFHAGSGIRMRFQCIGKGGYVTVKINMRSDRELERAETATESAGQSFKVLDEKVSTSVGSISLCTMHLAKGLEFRAVAVMACDDEVIPSQERIEQITDEADLEEVYNTERHLLYVACTRARDELLVTCVKPASEFLDDLRT